MQKKSQQARWRRIMRRQRLGYGSGNGKVHDKRGRSRMKVDKGVPLDALGLGEGAQGNKVIEEPPKTGHGRSRGEEGSRYSRGRAAIQLIHAATPVVHGRHR